MFISQAIPLFEQYQKIKISPRIVLIYLNEIRHLCISLKDPDIEQISHLEVVDYLSRMQQLGFATNGFINRVAGLRGFFQYFGRQDIATKLPYLQREYSNPRVANEEHYQKTVAAIPRYDTVKEYREIRNLAFITMLHDSGCRLEELIQLKIDNIDSSSPSGRVKTEKSRGLRVPFRQIFWQQQNDIYLRSWLKIRQLVLDKHNDESQLVFISYDGCKKEGGIAQPMTQTGIHCMLKRYARLAGVPYANPHSYRHAFGRQLAKNHAGEYEIMSFLGHQDVNSSRVYTRLYGTDLAENYSKLTKSWAVDSVPKLGKIKEYGSKDRAQQENSKTLQPRQRFVFTQTPAKVPV